MTTETTVSVYSPASFARRYRLPIVLGLLVVAVIIGLRLGLDHLAKQPIVDPYKSFIEQLAAASPEARSELQRYLAASGRDSLASGDFLPLCATMLRSVGNVAAISPAPNPALGQDRTLSLSRSAVSIAALCNQGRQP
jgi:hypothetical protein